MDTSGQGILSFIERLSSLQRLNCASVIEKGPQSVSFIERIFLLCHRMSITVEPPIKDTSNKGHLSIKDKSTRPNSYYTSTF